MNLKGFNPRIFASMLDACKKNPRMKSMLLVQLQSFSTAGQLCWIGNMMGRQIANELRLGGHRQARLPWAWQTRVLLHRQGSVRLSAGLVQCPRLAHLEESLRVAKSNTPSDDKAAD